MTAASPPMAKAPVTVCFRAPPAPSALAGVAFASEIVVLAPGDAEAVRAAVAGAKFPLVLLLDATEVVTPALAAELASVLARDPTAACYRVPRRGHYLGRAVQCPDWQGAGPIRLFDRRAGIALDSDPSAPSTPGAAGELSGEILTSVPMSLPSLLADIARASREAGGGRPSAVQLCLAPLFELWRSFWRRGGIGGGWAGLFLATMDSFYVLVCLGRRYARAERAAGPAAASRA